MNNDKKSYSSVLQPQSNFFVDLLDARFKKFNCRTKQVLLYIDPIKNIDNNVSSLLRTLEWTRLMGAYTTKSDLVQADLLINSHNDLPLQNVKTWWDRIVETLQSQVPDNYRIFSDPEVGIAVGVEYTPVHSTEATYSAEWSDAVLAYIYTVNWLDLTARLLMVRSDDGSWTLYGDPPWSIEGMPIEFYYRLDGGLLYNGEATWDQKLQDWDRPDTKDLVAALAVLFRKEAQEANEAIIEADKAVFEVQRELEATKLEVTNLRAMLAKQRINDKREHSKNIEHYQQRPIIYQEATEHRVATPTFKGGC